MSREKNIQRTYLMLKPDAYKRGLMGQIITKIENKGFKITNLKMMNLNEDIIKEHYAHIADKPFFPEISEFMTGGPVLAMIVEGDDVIAGMRRLMGPTKWTEALSGTIRGDFAYSTGENLIHGSDSEQTAKEEIERFFGKDA
jgi:nucleoside-diphosphate kinase